MFALTSLLVLAAVAAQPGPNACPSDVSTSISAAMMSCAADAGIPTSNPSAYPIIQLITALRASDSEIRQTYCAGDLLGCEALDELAKDDSTDCDYNYYKGQWFNVHNEVPCPAPSDDDNSGDDDDSQ
ncbi:Aste57867_19949 [Aphanomyces stellatus]|uniref:Aste57867_19949 protein n=1 Tax=Aphanomyces stellatus TaxID=120398 RepID=A0A485LFC0_9STRA|nr:hypothetical protein As57867_019883 [Aphanomyces stellatus]VFT96646.1 Aste57867_19949 [Aphanomyces stellatus]